MILALDIRSEYVLITRWVACRAFYHAWLVELYLYINHHGYAYKANKVQRVWNVEKQRIAVSNTKSFGPFDVHVVEKSTTCPSSDETPTATGTQAG